MDHQGSPPSQDRLSLLQRTVTELVGSEKCREVITIMLENLMLQTPAFINSLHKSSRDKTLLVMAIMM